MNSKSEFNRSCIPQLQVMEEYRIKEMEVEEGVKDRAIAEEPNKFDEVWARRKTEERSKMRKLGVSNWDKKIRKHGGIKEGRPVKRRKYALLKDWGDAKMIGKDGTEVEVLEIQRDQDDGASKVRVQRDGDSGSPMRIPDLVGVDAQPQTIRMTHPPGNPLKRRAETITEYFVRMEFHPDKRGSGSKVKRGEVNRHFYVDSVDSDVVGRFLGAKKERMLITRGPVILI